MRLSTWEVRSKDRSRDGGVCGNRDGWYAVMNCLHLQDSVQSIQTKHVDSYTESTRFIHLLPYCRVGVHMRVCLFH